MAIYLLNNSASPSVKTTRKLIVQAESAADARIAAAAYFNGDGSWANATATALTATTLDTAGSMLGYVWTINIVGAAAAPAGISVSYTGLAGEDLDAVAAKLVTALNATAINAAAYAAPNLTVAAIADGLGDAQVYLTVTPPSGDTKYDLSSLLYDSITDGGIAAAALVIALVADTEAAPVVLAEA